MTKRITPKQINVMYVNGKIMMAIMGFYQIIMFDCLRKFDYTNFDAAFCLKVKWSSS